MDDDENVMKRYYYDWMDGNEIREMAVQCRQPCIIITMGALGIDLGSLIEWMDDG